MCANSFSPLLVRFEPDGLQYWLVYHTQVNVPTMYRPHGRYRYIHLWCGKSSQHASKSSELSQNWRVATAMLVSVPPMFPGLIHSINSGVHIGTGTCLFNIAYLLGVSFLPFLGIWRVHRKRTT